MLLFLFGSGLLSDGDGATTSVSVGFITASQTWRARVEGSTTDGPHVDGDVITRGRIDSTTVARSRG